MRFKWHIKKRECTPLGLGQGNWRSTWLRIAWYCNVTCEWIWVLKDYGKPPCRQCQTQGYPFHICRELLTAKWSCDHRQNNNHRCKYFKTTYFRLILIPQCITYEPSILRTALPTHPASPKHIIKSLNTYGAFLLQHESVRWETSDNELNLGHNLGDLSLLDINTFSSKLCTKCSATQFNPWATIKIVLCADMIKKSRNVTRGRKEESELPQ